MLTVTLTPNRATDPQRSTRLVLYRREGDRVVPYLWEERDGQAAQCEVIRYRDIVRDYAADPEFARAWREHVESQPT